MPPPTDPLGLERQFESALKLVEKGIKEVTDAFQRLIDRANGLVRNVSFFSLAGALYLWKRIEDALNRLRELIDKLATRCKEVLDHSTPIYSLFRAAFGWSNDVQGPVSSKVGVVNRDAQSNLVNWKGNAHDAYRRKQILQVAAMTATAENSKEVGTWLVDLGKLNVDFVLKVVDPLAPIAAKLVEAAIDAGSLFGALEAIDSAAEAIGKLVEVLWQQLKAVAEYAAGLAGKMYDATKILNAQNGYPDGHWPQAVTI